MNTMDHSKCQHAIDEIRRTTSYRLKIMNDQCKKIQNDHDNRAYFKIYSATMADLAFDVIEHAVSYTITIDELEAFRERLQYADHALSVAIDVLMQSEETHLDWQSEVENIMHYH